ncbi:MarR family winged helix-turn-helix transcriptional regulator [uncultured Sulfitobacter sp.]|uniref:MarR family winged helix-turn-helix transcriptional regulator n=1 Tax=uncultured Sulfitobacter sp. TaxID=191468 RepID=UPI0030FC0662
MVEKNDVRYPNPTKLRDGKTVLDIEHYAPFLLNAISSAWQRKTSAIYRKSFGLSIVDWRVVAMLNIEPNITANRICEVIRIDKAAVSRSLRLLAESGNVFSESSNVDLRKRHWVLTEKGLQTHDAFLDIALRCDAELVAGVPNDELKTFLSIARRLLKNLDSFQISD